MVDILCSNSSNIRVHGETDIFHYIMKRPVHSYFECYLYYQKSWFNFMYFFISSTIFVLDFYSIIYADDWLYNYLPFCDELYQYVLWIVPINLSWPKSMTPTKDGYFLFSHSLWVVFSVVRCFVIVTEIPEKASKLEILI